MLLCSAEKGVIFWLDPTKIIWVQSTNRKMNANGEKRIVCFGQGKSHFFGLVVQKITIKFVTNVTSVFQKLGRENATV